MSRDYKVHLDDILQSCARIREYVQGYDAKKLKGDQKTYDAVVRNLEVIGEAVKNLPEDVRKEHSEVEWKRIAGLRDILIHEYFAVDADIVWDVVQNKLPALEEKVREMSERS